MLRQPKRQLLLVGGLGELGDQHHFGRIFQLAGQRQKELRRDPVISRRLCDADGAHSVARRGSFGCRLRVGTGLKVTSRCAGFGIERLTRELSVEILRILGGAVEMDDGRVLVAEGERGAAKPIFAKGNALGAGGDAAQRQEMAQGGVRIVQEAQRDPACQELGFDIAVARDEPVLGSDVVGDLRLPVVERAAAVDAPLGPPIVEVEKNVRLARRIEQHLPGLLAAFLVLGAAEPLDVVVA